MASSKQQYKTEQGALRYAWLNKPDTEYHAEGEYKTQIIIPADKAKSMLSMIKEFAKEELGKKAEKGRMPFDIDDETGDVTFKVKSKYAPTIVDSTGNPIVNNIPDIYGGTIAKVKGNVYAYDKGGNFGVGLTLLAVQIIQLGERKTSDSERFEAVANGWVADQSSSNDDSGSSSGDDDDYDF